jgi:hypothetical protein
VAWQSATDECMGMGEERERLDDEAGGWAVPGSVRGVVFPVRWHRAVGPRRGRGDREPTAGSALVAIRCGGTGYPSWLPLRFVCFFDLKKKHIKIICIV